MFRNPALRARSSWRYFCIFKRNLEACREGPSKYTLRSRGVMTAMLAGQEYGLNRLTSRVSAAPKISPNVMLALQRLSEFAFVGITEAWDLSICLFHAMFGAKCLPVEFHNTRNGTAFFGSPGTGFQGNATVEGMSFAGVLDQADWHVYVMAVSIFLQRLRRFVGRDTKRRCREICPAAPRPFQSFEDAKLLMLS